jgi:hypothetical protein
LGQSRRPTGNVPLEAHLKFATVAYKFQHAVPEALFAELSITWIDDSTFSRVPNIHRACHETSRIHTKDILEARFQRILMSELVYTTRKNTYLC